VDMSAKKHGKVSLLVGMAGSGKTSLLGRLATQLQQAESPPCIVNLDPAAQCVPYPVNIDIRDTVDYKALMKDYGLGPNGAILTAANLFATQFDKVINICQKHIELRKHVFFDTPGQIEIFTWSASGTMVTDMLASYFNTTILYILDTVQCQNPQILMSNMLQAVSVLYRSRLRVILVFNKTDIISHSPLLALLSDVNAFQKELENAGNFSSALTQTLNLVLQEFYENLDIIGVSATRGNGVDELLDAL